MAHPFDAGISLSRGAAPDLSNSAAQDALSAVSVKTFGATGDGVTDDASAINSLIASGGRFYFPEGTYIVGTALRLPDDTALILHPSATIKAKDSSYAAGLPCLATNDDPVGGNVNITIDGGVWDLNMSNNTRSDASTAEAIGVQMGGIGLRFRKVTGLKLSRMKVGNGRAFYIAANGSHGLAEDIEFYTPTIVRGPSANQDGFHLSGNSTDWTLRRIRGTTGDNIIGLGSDEIAPFSLESGPITKVRISDIYCTDTYGLGMYSKDEDISDVVIDGFHGTAGAAGYSVRFATEDPAGGFGYPNGGEFKNITIRNLTMPSPVIPWTNVEVKNLVIESSNVTHTGQTYIVDGMAGSNIEGLSLVNCTIKAVVGTGVSGANVRTAGRIIGFRSVGGLHDRSSQTANQQGFFLWMNGGSEIGDMDISGTVLRRCYGIVSQPAGTALTSVTANATTGLFTKTGHGLGNGSRVRLSALTGGSGFSTSTNYYVVANGSSTSTFYLATTRNGTAVTGGTDITAGTVTPLTVCGVTTLRGVTLDNCRRIWQGDTLYVPGKISMQGCDIGTINVNGTIEDGFQFNAGGTPSDLVLVGNTGTRVKRLIVLAGGSGTTRVESAANRITTVDQRELHQETGTTVSYSGIDFIVSATGNNGNAALTPIAGDVVADATLGVVRWDGASWI